MSLTEFDQKAYDRHRRREGFEDGFEQGEHSGIEKGIEKNAKENVRNFLAMNILTHEQIAKGVGLPIETIEELAAEMVNSQSK